MSFEKVGSGSNIPDEFNVVVEIVAGTDPVKYEIDKESGSLFVDRYVEAPVFYPYHYGFIPQSLAKDGDPLDVVLIANFSLIPGAVVKSRPIGVLIMEDESGEDEKIISVPVDKITRHYSALKDYKDLPAIELKRLEYFFTHYKDLEENKWVKVRSFGSIIDAKRFVEESVKRYK